MWKAINEAGIFRPGAKFDDMQTHYMLKDRTFPLGLQLYHCYWGTVEVIEVNVRGEIFQIFFGVNSREKLGAEWSTVGDAGIRAIGNILKLGRHNQFSRKKISIEV